MEVDPSLCGGRGYDSRACSIIVADYEVLICFFCPLYVTYYCIRFCNMLSWLCFLGALLIHSAFAVCFVKGFAGSYCCCLVWFICFLIVSKFSDLSISCTQLNIFIFSRKKNLEIFYALSCV